MANTSSRTLRLLSLLQTHRFWPGPELADRLEVSERTLRRDIERLRELGYPVDAARGSEGGYQLGAGATMPPLTVDEDEAIAMAVALNGAAQMSSGALSEASVSALSKVVQVLPPRLRRRAEALRAVTVDSPFSSAPPVRADVLATVAQSARDAERLRFTYRAAGGASAGSDLGRHVEPHRLVTVGRRWYLVAYDLDRQDWRSFRLDRLREPVGTRARFRPRDGARRRRGGVRPRRDVARGAGAARRGARVGTVRRGGAADRAMGSGYGGVRRVCRLEMSARDARWIVFGLAIVEAPFELVEAPEAVRHEMAEWADRFAAAPLPARRPPTRPDPPATGRLRGPSAKGKREADVGGRCEDSGMLLSEVVATAATVTATSSRLAKVEALADLLRRLPPEEVAPTVGFLIGRARQGRVGVGYRTVSGLMGEPAEAPSLTVADLDHLLDDLLAATGTGSAALRQDTLQTLGRRATADEQQFVTRVLIGEMRTGALEGVLVDAVAKASEVPGATVRRAVMLSGDLGETARLALTGGADALEQVGLAVGTPVLPMLASTAAAPAAALAITGEASVEYKLDGARIQVHRDGDDVHVYTRSLAEITHRVPEVVEVVRTFPATQLILDGETLSLDEDGGPRPFQDTMSRFGAEAQRSTVLKPWFFDILHVDGEDLIDRPLSERLPILEKVVGAYRIPGEVTADPATAERVSRDALAAGHEGIVVKGVDSVYAAWKPSPGFRTGGVFGLPVRRRSHTPADTFGSGSSLQNAKVARAQVNYDDPNSLGHPPKSNTARSTRHTSSSIKILADDDEAKMRPQVRFLVPA